MIIHQEDESDVIEGEPFLIEDAQPHASRSNKHNEQMSELMGDNYMSKPRHKHANLSPRRRANSVKEVLRVWREGVK